MTTSCNAPPSVTGSLVQGSCVCDQDFYRDTVAAVAQLGAWGFTPRWSGRDMTRHTDQAGYGELLAAGHAEDVATRAIKHYGVCHDVFSLALGEIGDTRRSVPYEVAVRITAEAAPFLWTFFAGLAAKPGELSARYGDITVTAEGDTFAVEEAAEDLRFVVSVGSYGSLAAALILRRRIAATRGLYTLHARWT